MNKLSRRRYSLILTFIIGFTVLTSVQPLLAHGYLLRSIPEDRAVLERAPARLQYWFSESLEGRFSSLAVRDDTGNTIATGGIDADNNALLVARLPRNLADGVYIVDMRIAFASDGHVIAQTRTFTVGQGFAEAAAGEVSNQANALEVVWRTLLISSTLLLFGTFVTYQTILVPAWGNAVHRAGLLPPRVMRRLNIIVVIALIVAFSGNILALIQQTMSFFDTGLVEVINQNLWSVTRVGTRFGDLWNSRMLLMGLVTVMFGLSLYWRDEHPETVHPFWAANAWLMALVIGSFSAGSHAAGSITVPWFAVFNDWFHGLAAGLWIGGLGALALTLSTALSPYQGDQRRLALLAALKRFSRLATACVAIVIATGFYSATNWIYAPSDLTSTAFGGALILKLIMVSALLLLGLLHHMATRPERFQRWQQLTQRVNTFIPSLRLEYVLSVAVLASVGLLSATPVPIPYFIQESIPSPSATQTLDDLTVNLTITPGGAGVNTYDTLITQNNRPVDTATVRIQLVNPERDQRSDWQSVEFAESGLYIGAGAEINITGKWWSLVDVSLPDNSTTRAAFEWNISEEAAIQQWRPLGLQHVLALFAVLAAAGWTIYPSAHRLYLRLDLNPLNVAISLAVIAATILLSAGGFLVIRNSQNQFEATLNPTPLIINTVLPDAPSLARGKMLYDEHCSLWNDNIVNKLAERLPRTRDEQLFVITRDGLVDIPACNNTLSDLQRWDVVNYIRTFEK